jgi:glutamate dehydrogenase
MPMDGAHTPKPLDELHAYLVDRLAVSLDARELRRRGRASLEASVSASVPFIERRDGVGVRVSNSGSNGRERTVIEVLAPDQPFLVDTFHLTMRRLDLRETVFAHPVLQIDRDEDGRLIAHGADAIARDGWLWAEVPTIHSRTAREAIEVELSRVFRELCSVVEDHGSMIEVLREHAVAMHGDPERARERREFLEWLAEDNYIFLGYRRYAVSGEPLCVGIRDGTGLGLLRDAAGSRFREPRSGESIPEVIRERLSDPRVIFFDKSRSTSTIHREGRLDCVTVKEVDADGRTVGFGRFIGLLTYKAIRTPASVIPILRSRRDRVLESIGAEPGSHTYKAAITSFDSLPLEFLFPFDPAEITAAVERVLKATEVRGFEVAAVPDPRNRSFFLSAVIPRARYDESLREQVHTLLVERYGVIYADHRSSFIDEELALIHFFCTCSEDVELHVLDRLVAEVQEQLRGWEDGFETALLDTRDESRAYAQAAEYGPAFPDSYRRFTTPADAVRDVERLERLRRAESRVELDLLRGSGGDARLKVYLPVRPYLSDLLPIIDEFGLCVVDATTTELPTRRGTFWIVSFRIEALHCDGVSQARVLEGLGRALRGEVENSPLHRLILRAGLDWREVDLLRAYAFYAHQIGAAPQQRYLCDTLCRYPAATRALVDLFRARFEPELPRDREHAERMARDTLEAAREPIPTAQEDRVFALLQDLVCATLRTDFFVPSGYHQVDEHSIVLKIGSGRVRHMPSPRPHTEIWVHTARMTGIHLRGGRIARGGVRWSERPQDLRTEVLGLMKTQMVKNGVIVPLGSKGGFVLKGRIDDPAELRATADREYASFIRCLLRVTDDVRDGEVVHPERVVCHDDDDPYLVVAPDKGTAHLSDVANAIAIERGFWLGDAFASGGSEGYDHKACGITARGAWTCVKRHFVELGLDPDAEPFSVAGIGDMSGDVFGNGLVLMRRAQLLAAFDHRHVFLDPDPDPERSWQERKRLFELEGSSWLDYDPAFISRGGGVFPRDARSIAISPEARAALGVESERLSGDALVRAILCMPVDLLWNGGIGTYVRASTESDDDAGDRANDGVRIDAGELRARIVGEGGNLGLTQLARVEYALAGGCVNTDAVDNSGGVDLSDHEVNFKIASAGLERDERNRRLRDCVDTASATVLEHSREQARCLSLDMLRAAADPERLEGVLDFLCREGGLDPHVEFLPSEEDRRIRHWVRPELAVLLGYTKMLAKRALAGAERIDAAPFGDVLRGYFPEPLRDAAIGEHPLRREITATRLTNRVIDRAGVTLLPSLVESLGAGVPELICAAYVLDELLEAERLRERIDAAPIAEPLRLEARLLVEDGVRVATRDWLGLEEALPDLERWRGRLPQTRQDEAAPRAAELGPALARDLEHFRRLARSLAVVPVVERTGARLADALALHARIGEELQSRFLLDRLETICPDGRWDRAAAESLHLDVVITQREVCERLLRSSDPPGVFFERHADALRTLRETALEIEADSRAGLSALGALGRRIRLLG